MKETIICMYALSTIIIILWIVGYRSSCTWWTDCETVSSKTLVVGLCNCATH